MKIVYSNDKNINTVVVDMRDLLEDIDWTVEIPIYNLYRYVQIFDLSQIFPKEILDNFSKRKLISAIISGEFNLDGLTAENRDVLKENYLQFIKDLNKKFNLPKNYILSLINDNSKFIGSEYIEFKDNKDIDIPIKVWANSLQYINVFKNPQNNKLRYAYGGISPSKDWWEEFFSSIEKQEDFKRDYIIDKNRVYAKVEMYQSNENNLQI